MEMTNNGSRNGLREGPKTCESDPLQMLAKQCDTISGDEEGNTKGAKGQKSIGKGEGKGATTILAQNQQQQQKAQTKTKSPNKHLFDQQCLPSQAILPNGGFLPPHPSQLAALMNPFLGPISQQRHPQPHPMGPPPPFPPNSGAPPQFGPPPPAQLSLMQQLMAAVQQQMPSPHLLPPAGQMFPPPHPVHSGIPLPPSMAMSFRKPDQTPNIAASQAEIEAAALTQAMAMFHGAPVLNNSFSRGNMPSAENGASVQQLLQQPLQNILMAIACGQLPQIPCLYKMPGGALCGRVFPSDDQLLAHFKSAHIAQMSSPSAVSSTTEGSATASTIGSSTTQTTQTPTTATGGGKMRQQGNKNSPSSSRSTPTNGQNQAQINNGQKPNSNPGSMVFNGGGWPPHLMPQMGILPPPPPPPQAFLGGGGTGQHRFHPYMVQQNGQHSSKGGAQPPSIQPPPPTQNQLQQMAMALMTNGGGLSLISGLNPDLGAPQSHPHPPSQALNALTAMANSIDATNQPTGQTTNSSASVGAGSG